MKKDSQLTPEDFENLLARLSADRDEAGVIYEKIRFGLIRYFRVRGCADEESLADETINRVAKKIGELTSDNNPQTHKFFYGFARNIRLEYLANRRELEFNPDYNYVEMPQFAEIESKDARYGCLENCLSNLSEGEKQILLRYYGADKIAKIKLRQKMAEDLNLSVKNLHTKVYRMRINLKKCIRKCLDEK